MTHDRSSQRRRVAQGRPAGESQRPEATGAARPQRVGNRGMQRLLDTAAALAPAAAPRWRLGAADDPLEHEADRVAAQVTAGAAGGSAPPDLRPASAPGGAGEAGAAPASVERALAEPGQPLAPALQDDMGRRFGHDFSGVRVHAGPQAGQSAREISARAYTAGRHIVFGAGQFAPGTAQGRRLLAHELAHTVQQARHPSLQAGLVQRDLAIAPTVPNPAEVVLTAAQMRAALRHDTVVFSDAAEISVVRDVLGIPREPATVDEDFVNAVIRYQGSFGLTQDGLLGAATAGQLSQEITAEADRLNQPASGTPLRRVARRLHLRSMTSRRRGRVTHQGFVGPDDNPEGAVAVRLGDREGTLDNSISVEYTGEDADAVDWVQFLNMQMFATPPGAAAPVFNTGVVATTGGDVTWSDATTTHWACDGVPAPSTSPLYNVTAGLDHTRGARRRIAIFDQPGGAGALPVAQAFAAPGGLAAGATTVTMRMRFDSYAIRANRAFYHVAWTATTTYDITAGTAGDIVYTQGAADAVTRMRGVHRTAMLAEYPGTTIR
jgi:hypothetical protein